MRINIFNKEWLIDKSSPTAYGNEGNIHKSMAVSYLIEDWPELILTIFGKVLIIKL